MGTPTTKKRNVKGHPTVPIVPRAVSQLTSLPMYSIDERRFRELVHKWRIPHSQIGSLLVVLCVDFEAFLAKMAERGETEDGDERPMSTDEMLAALGRERV